MPDLPMITGRIIAMIALLCLLTASTVSAFDPYDGPKQIGWLQEVRAGLLAHDVDDLWSGSSKEEGVDFSAELVTNYPDMFLWQGHIRSNLGLSINSQGDTSTLYAGLLWDRDLVFRTFISLGLGLAVHNGELAADEEDKKGLGSRILFRVPLELGYRFGAHHRVMFFFVHLSNAHLASPNEGMDMLGLRYGYRF
jgi:hypothetical protein